MHHIAVVGSGFIGKAHAQVIKALPQARLAAIINPNPKTASPLAEELGCAWYPSLKEAMKEQSIDIVDVCSPTFLHEQHVLEAADAGCHVLCEKPVTFTLESFDRMAKACRDRGLTFMVAQVARWWPEFIDIGRRLSDGSLGRKRFIYEKRLCRLPGWSTWHPDPKKSGGGLYDLNIHDIDFLLSVLGRPESVYAAGWQNAQGAWMHVATSLMWKDGLKAVVETCIDMPGPWPFSIEFRATGDGGTLHYNLMAGVNIKDGEQNSAYTWYPAGSEEPQPLSVEQSDMFASEITEFLSAIDEKREPAVTLAQSRAVLEVILATRRSLESGKAQTL